MKKYKSITNFSLCDKGLHKYVETFSIGSENEGYKVIRWCYECGAIVGDFDYDGRTDPGRIMKLRYPNITKDYYGKKGE